MKIPISKRLRLCAQLVPPGARVADIGTDHGYLGLYLLQNGRAAHVLAADLRPQPLQTAKLHAAKFGFAGQMEFRLSDGLAEIGPDEADTIVCAGMGGDLIVEILSACPWLRDRNYTLILQPQSAGQELRRWLGEHGFAIACEQLVQDGKFLYTVLRAHPGAALPLAGRAVRLAVAAPERLAAARCLHAAHRNCPPPQRGGPDGRGASAARAPGLLPVSARRSRRNEEKS